MNEIKFSKLNELISYLVGFSLSGFMQIVTEQPTAYVNGVFVEKFPNGMNYFTEMFEGGLPAVLGIFIANMVYYFVLKLKIRKNPNYLNKLVNIRFETVLLCLFKIFGAIIFYFGMVMAGYFIHQYLNIPDVDLFQIISNILKK
ncbi:MAG: hypothetical protein Fur0024_1630 [Patescibacteria group bacterium]